MKVHYISSFADTKVINDYMTTPSARAKVEYIKDSLKAEGISVCLYSPIRCRSNNRTLLKRRSLLIDELEIQRYPFSFGGKAFVYKLLSYIFIFSQLIWYLSTKVKKNEIVLLYHALPDTYILKYYCKIRKLNVFLEVEELFNAVYGNKEKIEKEKKLILSFPNGYILVNNVIGGICNITKPSVVCEGQYKMMSKEPKKTIDNEGVANLLYAGVIKKDSDVFFALKTVKNLDSSFCLHIAGYGDSVSERLLLAEIDGMNKNNHGCKVVYHGCLYGKDYEQLLQQCSIGLCTRLLEDELSNYTFPSKVFAYLTRNLRVISTPITCILKSTISDSIVFSETVHEKDFVDAIHKSLEERIIDNLVVVDAEDKRFKKEIIELFNNT